MNSRDAERMTLISAPMDERQRMRKFLFEKPRRRGVAAPAFPVANYANGTRGVAKVRRGSAAQSLSKAPGQLAAASK